MATAAFVARPVLAAKVVMKDGRTFEGRVAPLATTGKQAVKNRKNGAPDAKPIVLCDDGLAHRFVSRRQVEQLDLGGGGSRLESFDIEQRRVVREGSEVASVGRFERVTPFDEFGRRTVEMRLEERSVPIIQAITQITPVWAKLESIRLDRGASFVWEMRVATSSIPAEVLRQVLERTIQPDNFKHRLKLARFYLQMERYQDAHDELQRAMKQSPDSTRPFAAALGELRQEVAARTLAEIAVRRDAGQHQLAAELLEQFPAEGAAGETLVAVRQSLDDYRRQLNHCRETVKWLDDDLAAVSDSATRSRAKAIRDEIAAELNLNGLDRLAAYRRLHDDATLSADSKAALAISGWLVGADDAVQNLPVALSLVEVRDQVRAYLVQKRVIERRMLLKDLRSREGATPDLVSKLLRYALPPLPAEPIDDATGLRTFQYFGLPDEPLLDCYVQLPPEYDPHRLYPAIVALDGAGSSPQQEIDWWAGPRGEDGRRLGQATRFGYIVIAPDWARLGQKQYQMSAAEHAAVLHALREACGRFAIDTDRVFLSGHSMGGDAAWDIGLAHPDLWAGVIPISARGERYLGPLDENCRHVPLYLVTGELDGNDENVMRLDRCLSHGYNLTAVEFVGRGREHFSDEIFRLFDWMNRLRRDFYLKEFDCTSIRTWDNGFWWVELADFPAALMANPPDWPPGGTKHPRTTAQVNASTGIVVRSGAHRATIWLTPEVADFRNKIAIRFNGAAARLADQAVEPSLEVMLEDARTRADRQHPFWAKIEMPGSRANTPQ
ncbi:MAG TPA: peptidase [Pirellulales bacterium]